MACPNTNLLLRPLGRARTLHSIATFDNICLQAYRSWTAMQLQEETAGIAQHGADLVASPERGGAGGAILAGRL
jgi:hypothetical protein